jgi:23S rRNA (guanosine2251-2'-O)-methyltransferase
MERVPFLATNAAAAYENITQLPVAVMLENVRSIFNVGSFFRTSDAAGIEKLILCGITGHPPMPALSKTALGSEDRVRWEHTWNTGATVRDLQASGYEIAAVETSAHSVDLFDWTPRFPVCVVFGHEVEGIQKPLLDLCDTHVRIPMLGRKHSLNVATAGGIVIYELLRKYRRMVENVRDIQ